MVDRSWVVSSLVDGPRLRTLQVRGQLEVDAEVLRAVLESRRRAGRGFLMAMAAPGTGEPAPDRWSAIVDTGAPTRWRVEQGTSVFVNDGATVTFLNDREAFTRPADRHDDPPGPISDILRPAGFAVAYELGEPLDAEHLGRRCVAVIGTFKTPAEPMRAGPSPQFGDRCRLILDVDAGLIVKWQSWFGGDQLAAMALDLVEVDQPVPDDAFHLEIPPGVQVRTPEELLEGRTGTRRRGDSSQAFESLGDYMPHGAPPADPAAAEAAIRAAVEAFAALSPDGRDALNIHGGQGLGPAFEEASSRFSLQVQFELRATRFLSDDQAAVAFSISGLQTPIHVEGRMILIEGRWLIERDTAARLLRRAGVELPPPPTGC